MTSAAGATLQADVAIVGSGIAGAITAYELARAGIKVVVLEAGPRIERAGIVDAHARNHKHDLSGAYPNTALAPRPDWGQHRDGYHTNIGPDRLECEYLRVVGGTTWHWAAWTAREGPFDLELKSRYGIGVDWPIRYADLEPFYARAERELGVGGDASAAAGVPRSSGYPFPPTPRSYLDHVVSERLAAAGFPLVTCASARNSRRYDGRGPCVGFGSCMPICPSGAQYAAIVHVEKAEALGVRVIENALVTRIDVDESGEVASFEYKRSDGSRGRLVARAYVVAANGIETPRLLLASRSPRVPRGVANARDQVGRYLMDHPGFNLSLVMPEPVYPGRGPQTNLVSYGSADGGFRRTRAAYVFTLYNSLDLNEIASDLLTRERIRPPRLDAAMRHRAMREVRFGAQVELLPDTDNRVQIDEGRRDSSGMPGIVVRFAIGEYTKRGLAHARATFGRIARVLKGEHVRYSNIYSTHHPAGTARMGDDPAVSVVDRDCRTHEHRNLYIAGSSVFSTSGTVSPSLTIAALALRLAETIRDDLGRRESR